MYVAKGDLTKLPVKRQRKICKCETKCKIFITVAGYDHDVLICYEDAKKLAFDVLHEIGLYSDFKKKPNQPWTTNDEQFLIDYIAKNGRHNGYYEIMGKAIGRSRTAVKVRVAQMKKEGKLC